MFASLYRIIGRRLSQPQTLLFQDHEGRHFLRAGCGARLVRITVRDAHRIMRHYDYHAVLDRMWLNEAEARDIDCPLPGRPAIELPVE